MRQGVIRMIGVLREVAYRIKKTLFSKDYNSSFYNALEVVGKFLFLIIVSFVCITQVSTFLDYNLNKINYFLILFLFIVFLLLNFKETILALSRILVLCIPLLLLCAIAKFINHSTFFPEMIVMTLTSFVVFVIAYLSKKLLFKNNYTVFCVTYLIGCIFFIVFALFIDGKILFAFGNATYSYFSKNSASPMLCCGLIFVPYVFSKHNLKNIIFKSILYFLFVPVILLLRCRSAIMCLPLIFLYNIYKRDRNSKEKWLWILFLFITIVLVFIIPPLRNVIIGSFAQSASGGTSIDDISSGRFTQLFNAFKGFSKLNIFFGKGSGYVDIMPAFLVCYFGISGLLIYGFIIFVWVYLIFKTNKSTQKDILVLLLVFFFVNGLFEAYGMFGPGAKVFALWAFSGFALEADFSRIKLFKRCLKDDKKFKDAVNKLEFKHVLAAVLCILTITFVSVSLVPSLSNSAGTITYSLIPRNGKKYETISAQSVDIDVEKQGNYKTIEMFVGEKRTLTATVKPKETLDKKLYWNTYQPSILNVDHETGEITALASGYAAVVCHVNNKREIVDESLRVFVSNGDGIASSITFSAVSPTSVSKNESVIFDSKVFPNYLKDSDVEIRCSDPSAAIINKETNSIVPLVVNSSFNVWAEYLNSDGTLTQSESITISTGPETINECTSIELPDFGDSLYEKDYIELNPIVPERSDGKYRLIFNKNDVALLDDGRIQFLKSGEISLTIISTFNPNVKQTKQLLVAANKLIEIEYSTNWSMVGKLNKIDVLFVYESGLKIIPNASEFKITISGDKYAETVSDSCFYFAKAVGTFSGRIISKANPNVYSWYEITNWSISQEQYDRGVKTVTALFKVFVLFLLTSSLFFVKIFKTKKSTFIFKISYIVVLSLIAVAADLIIIKSILCLALSLGLLLTNAVLLIANKKEIKDLSCEYVELPKQTTPVEHYIYEINI